MSDGCYPQKGKMMKKVLKEMKQKQALAFFAAMLRLLALLPSVVLAEDPPCTVVRCGPCVAPLAPEPYGLPAGFYGTSTPCPTTLCTVGITRPTTYTCKGAPYLGGDNPRGDNPRCRDITIAVPVTNGPGCIITLGVSITIPTGVTITIPPTYTCKTVPGMPRLIGTSESCPNI